MTETAQRQLLRLMSWMSPAFPTGAFAYSQGLESAVHDGLVPDGNGLRSWLADALEFGTLWNDSVLFCESWRRVRDDEDVADVAELAEAMIGSSGRHLESVGQGRAFAAAARAWHQPVLDRLPDACPLPVAAGTLAAGHAVPLETALAAFLHAAVSNLVQASLRLLPITQQDGVELMAHLEQPIMETIDRAVSSTLADLGSATFLAEIASLRHETLHSRIFRS